MQYRRLATAAALVALLAGCGGGGGSTSSLPSGTLPQQLAGDARAADHLLVVARVGHGRVQDPVAVEERDARRAASRLHLIGDAVDRVL